jgi:hypothetical protein
MKYTKHMFATELIQKLKEEPFSIVKMSNWCNRIYIDHLREMDDELYYLVFELSTMDDDPQFEYGREELRLLAEKLINNEKNPTEQINETQSKELD